MTGEVRSGCIKSTLIQWSICVADTQKIEMKQRYV